MYYLSLKCVNKEMEIVETLEYNREVAMKKGEEEGRAEGAELRNYEIARAMKKNGLPWSEIILYTGLSVEEIERM